MKKTLWNSTGQGIGPYSPRLEFCAGRPARLAIRQVASSKVLEPRSCGQTGFGDLDSLTCVRFEGAIFPLTRVTRCSRNAIPLLESCSA